MGENKWLAYHFSWPLSLDKIYITDNYSNTYTQGDLIVKMSSDSSNGSDGSWVNLSSMDASTTTFINGDGYISFVPTIGSWLKLDMTYTGTGAYGGSPSFYLTEIDFYGETIPPPVPEPTTLSLLGLGLLGLTFKRKRFA